jgi:3-hydroxyphenylacetate 6-hydroxylase
MGLNELSIALAHWALNSPVAASILLPFGALLLYIILNELVRYNARIKGFGGPSGFPLIGVIWHISGNAAEKYRQWAQRYGGVYQVQLGNVPVIVVNDAASAKQIFGQNSQALASRPETYTFHKVLSSTAGTTIGTSPYSESLKRRRKGAASALNRPSIATYTKHLDIETRDFVAEFLQYGKAGQVAVDPTPMIQRLSLSLALTLNWGDRIASQEHELFHEITEVEDGISRFRSTTGNLQDYIPILRLNPFSVGSKVAAEMRDRRDKYLSKLNRELDERIAAKTHKPCIQVNVILDPEAKLDKEELISISLTMLSGGLDTITTLLQWSIALLAVRQDIQREALEAIRDFYSEDRPLCDPEDDQGCQYVVALVRECLRYFTVLRLALPRATIKEITFEGKRIPQGTWIFLNAWACNMGKLFRNPMMV